MNKDTEKNESANDALEMRRKVLEVVGQRTLKRNMSQRRGRDGKPEYHQFLGKLEKGKQEVPVRYTNAHQKGA